MGVLSAIKTIILANSKKDLAHEVIADKINKLILLTDFHGFLTKEIRENP